jgi:serine protease Do
VKLGKSEGEKMAQAEEEGGKEGAPSKADVVGLVVRSISPEDAARLDIPAGYKGVVVSRVEPGSSAEGADIRSGDIILEVNNAKVTSVSEYQDAAKGVKKGDIIRLLVKRGHASIYVAFRA